MAGRETLVWIEPIPGETIGTQIFDNIRKHHPQLTVKFLPTPEGQDLAEGCFRDASIICTFGRLPTKREDAPNLKMIQMCSAGSNHIHDHWAYKDPRIVVITASGLHGPQASEWAVLQILSHSHKQKMLLEWHQKHQWGDSIVYGNTKPLLGMRLGVLGYGSIGRQVSRVCKAMGMDVIAFTASPRENVESKRDQGYIIPGTGDPDGSLPSAWYSGTTKASLHHFLEQDIDILLICLPLTKSTTKCIGPEEFKILGKRNAFVLNIARGAIIDQAALSAALRLDLEEGGLKGAAVDVTDREPLPADSEFWDTPNLIITPHISGQALGYYAGVLNILDLNLTKIGEGKQLLNMVNKSKGY